MLHIFAHRILPFLPAAVLISALFLPEPAQLAYPFVQGASIALILILTYHIVRSRLWKRHLSEQTEQATNNTDSKEEICKPVDDPRFIPVRIFHFLSFLLWIIPVFVIYFSEAELSRKMSMTLVWFTLMLYIHYIYIWPLLISEEYERYIQIRKLLKKRLQRRRPVISLIFSLLIAIFSCLFLWFWNFNTP